MGKAAKHSHLSLKQKHWRWNVWFSSHLDWCEADTTPLKPRTEVQEEKSELLHSLHSKSETAILYDREKSPTSRGGRGNGENPKRNVP